MSLGIPAQFGFTPSPGSYNPGVWSQTGKTPGGQNWELKCTNCRDCEDNDTTHELIVGDLTFATSSDCGRDYASDSVSARHTSGVSWSSRSGRGRDGSSSSVQDSKHNDEMRSFIAQAAAREGMAPKAFVEQLPRLFSSALLAAQLA